MSLVDPFKSNPEVNRQKIQTKLRSLFMWTLKELNPLRAKPTKTSKTLKQIVSQLPTNCLSVFDYFMRFALKG